MEFGTLMRLVGVMNLILILSYLEGREPYIYDFAKKKKKKNIGLYSDICRLIFFKLGMIIEKQ